MLKSFLFWGNGDWAQGKHLSCARKSSGASADWAQSRQDWQCFALVERICAKYFLDKISCSPVWNFLGETRAFFLTFYAKK